MARRKKQTLKNTIFTGVEEVHDYLLTEAADRANQELQRKDQTARYQGEIYRPDSGRSEKGGLCLSLDEGLVETLTPAELVQVHAIGREAIEWVLRHRADILAGLVVGEARRGTNYFARFGPQAVGEQGSLF